MTRWLLIIGLASSLGCASLTAKLPHLPDGSLDVQTLLTWAQDGIDATCAIGPNTSICTFGADAIRIARSKGDAASVKQSLSDSAARWPAIDPWVRWLINDL